MREPKNTLLWVVLLLAPVGLEAGDACKSLLEVFEEHFSDSKVYRSGFCLENAGELARVFSQKLKTQIDIEKLRILVVRHRNLPGLSTPFWELNHNKLIVGSKSRSKANEMMKFHAVVEYEGHVLDLDYDAGAQMVPFQQFMQTMFPRITGSEVDSSGDIPHGHIFNQEEDLVITPIPATAYFSRHPKRPIGDGQISIADEFPYSNYKQFRTQVGQ